MTTLNRQQPNSYISQIFAAYKGYQAQKKKFDINQRIAFKKPCIGEVDFSFHNAPFQFLNINGEIVSPQYKVLCKDILICAHNKGEREDAFFLNYWFGEGDMVFSLTQKQAKNLFFLLEYLDNAHSSINYYLMPYTTEEQIAGLYTLLAKSTFFEKTENGLVPMNTTHLFQFAAYLNVVSKNKKVYTDTEVALKNAAKTKIKQALADLTIEKAS